MNQKKEIENYKEMRKDQLARWVTFTQERFEPVSHFIMIFLFLTAHYMVADASKYVVLEPVQILWVTLGTTLFFLKLRFYDEIKDYELDLEKNPNRPLPRGLLGHFDLKKGIENCIILEIIFFTTCGIQAFFTILAAISYSLLMYKEFFIPEKIRPHLTTYATSHTVITLFISFSIFSAMGKTFPWDFDHDFYYFALMSWLLFNIFELGRKTYQPCEEREGVPTYSNIWGKWGAFLLVFSHAILVGVCALMISTMDFFYMQLFMAFCLFLLFLVGVIYAFGRRPITGNLYRLFSSFYIVLIYLGIISNYIMRRWL